MSRERIISDMCVTWRHDFGLLEVNEREYLWNQMAQIYDNVIAPRVTSREEMLREVLEFVEQGHHDVVNRLSLSHELRKRFG
jgi:hypothetical protein